MNFCWTLKKLRSLSCLSNYLSKGEIYLFIHLFISKRHPLLQRMQCFNAAVAISGAKNYLSNANTVILFGTFCFFCNMENSLKVQMVEPLCTQTVKLVRVETMLWVLKLQLVWCLRGPRGSSTTTAPDGLRRHRCSTRAVTSHLPALMAIAKNCT